MIPELLARALASSSPVRLNSMAAEYGLKSVSGVWWVRKSVTHPVSRQERQFKKSTKRTDLRDALAVAVPWVDRWLAEVQTDRAEPLGVKREWATLGEVVDFYLTWPNGRQHTRDRCARELGTMAGECWPDREWRGISTEMLTRDERLKWRQMRELASAKAHLPADAEAHERTKRNINQMIANTSGEVEQPGAERPTQHCGAESEPKRIVAGAADVGKQAWHPRVLTWMGSGRKPIESLLVMLRATQAALRAW